MMYFFGDGVVISKPDSLFSPDLDGLHGQVLRG